MKKWKRKWKRNEIVRCSQCDYLCRFDAADEPFCANNHRKVDDPTIKNPDVGRICRFYFPNYKMEDKDGEQHNTEQHS